MIKKSSGWVGLFFVLVMGFSLSLPSARTQDLILETGDHQYGELVVKLRADSDRSYFSAYSGILSHLEKTIGDNSVLSIRPFATDSSMQIIRLSRDEDLPQAIARIAQDPSVEIVEPNFLYTALGDGVPNDPDFTQSWGMKNTGQTDRDGNVGRAGSDINVMPLWREGFRGSKKIVVGVIDTGIDWDHPDLHDNLYTNPGEVDGDGKDNDGNGFIDDVHGWNFGNNNNNSRDNHGHGTHCAGTIGGVGNNATGIAGVNWQVSLMPIKFLGSNAQGTLQATVDSIRYAIKMKVPVLSNSWGNHTSSELLLKTIQEAKDAGIVFVAAAGNSREDNAIRPTFPAAYPVENIISVAATNNRDHLGNFSSFGETSVHVAAPGVNIHSTFLNGGYKIMSGTSMAAPHVAGIAGLLLSAHPTMKFPQAKERLIRTSDPVPILRHRVIAGGRVNAFNAVHGIIPPNPAPNPGSWISEPFHLETPHPYLDRTDQYFDISHQDAKYIRIHFSQFDFQKNADFVFLEKPSGEVIQDLTGKLDDFMTDFVPGDRARLHLVSNRAASGFGFVVDRIEYVLKN